MFKKLVCIICLLLSGCGYDMTPSRWQAAVDLCKPFGGLAGASRVEYANSVIISVICNDRQTIRKEFKLEEIRKVNMVNSNSTP